MALLYYSVLEFEQLFSVRVTNKVTRGPQEAAGKDIRGGKTRRNRFVMSGRADASSLAGQSGGRGNKETRDGQRRGRRSGRDVPEISSLPSSPCSPITNNQESNTCRTNRAAARAPPMHRSQLPAVTTPPPPSPPPPPGAVRHLHPIGIECIYVSSRSI
ncbi:hypothetical protein E2C01_026990 [Portunus trituberculatus]|uniref:Uncharacterized protein n=1 Tax=Portunus trituberculatus TaxID=210409 RepID=A0A5B7EJQ4_PORTR|nr:hypothetical protein [Portunus trituberculatus]